MIPNLSKNSKKATQKQRTDRNMTMDNTTIDNISNGTSTEAGAYGTGGSVLATVITVLSISFVVCSILYYFEQRMTNSCKCTKEACDRCCFNLHDCCSHFCDSCESRFTEPPSCSECSAPECIPMSLCREQQTTDQDAGTGQQRHQTEMGPSAPSFSDLNEENHTSITLQDERLDPPPEPSAPPPSDPLAPPPSYENVMANNQYVAPPALPEDPVPPPPSYSDFIQNRI